MGYYLIAYNSVTFANRIMNHFRYNKDFLGVVHTPKGLSPTGCSYSVKVREGILNDVIEVSEGLGFQIKGVFLRMPDGKYREVTI